MKNKGNSSDVTCFTCDKSKKHLKKNFLLIIHSLYTVFGEGGLLKRKGEVKKEYSLEKKGLKGRYVHKCSKIKGLNVQRAKHFKGPKGSEGLKGPRVKGPKGQRA